MMHAVALTTGKVQTARNQKVVMGFLAIVLIILLLVANLWTTNKLVAEI